MKVVGDNAIFANPFDYKAIAAALESGVYDIPLREQLKKKGLGHAKTFSWDQMIEKTIQVYELCENATVLAPSSLDRVEDLDAPALGQR
ncbi:MAG: hypothetical protein EOP04_31730 [Proteobacteria bacterium]|nr:MAG: hypothetical protein EOP04_31730 [Pseudomonadota bacterium]